MYIKSLMNKGMLVGILILVLVLIAGGYFAMNSGLLSQSANQLPGVSQQMPATPGDTNIKETVVENQSSSDSAATQGSVKEFTIENSGLKFVPNQLTVNKGDTVKITFKNTGGTHDFTLDEFNVATKQINNGQSDTVEFVADKAGSFEFYCSVGNHRAQGMKGTLTLVVN